MPKKSLVWIQKLPWATVTCPNCRHQVQVFVQYRVTDVKAYKVESKRLTKRASETDTDQGISTDTMTDGPE